MWPAWKSHEGGRGSLSTRQMKINYVQMKRSKKVFFLVAAIFLVIMFIIGYDMSKRTTWPGAKKNLKERITE